MVTLTTAHAEIFTVPTGPNLTLETIQNTVENALPAELGNATCGWIATDESVGDDDPIVTPTGDGKIAKVEGLPGREGEPLGLQPSGMAKRLDTFSFPETGEGLSTACPMTPEGEEPGNITWNIWKDGPDGSDGEFISQDLPFPRLDNPPCTSDTGGDDLSRENCQNKCDDLNRQQFEDCKLFTIILFDEETGDEVGETDVGEPIPAGLRGVQKCKTWGMRYLCTGHWVPVDEEPETFPNCRVCTGESCRCTGTGCRLARVPEPPVAGTTTINPATNTGSLTYKSFFREYFGFSRRQKVNAAPDDKLAAVGDAEVCADVTDRTPEHLADREEKCITASCYGFYGAETDWKTKKLESDDERCLIRFPGSIERDNLKTSQSREDAYQPVPLPDETLENRTPVSADDAYPWQPILQTMSFLKAGENGIPPLTQAILTPDTAELKAMHAFTTDKPLPAGNNQRATDDTVAVETDSARFVTRWLQGLLTGIQEALRPPVIHVRVPALWETFLPASAVTTATLPALNSPATRQLPIDFQVRAGPGTIDELATMLKRVMTIKQEELSLVVPLGTRIDFENRALQWERYRDLRTKNNLAVPAEVDALITTLHAYANRIDQVRTIRAQLPLYLAMIVERQGQAIDEINTWVGENVDRFSASLDAQDARVSALEPLAHEIAVEALRFGVEVNMPWCRSDRFTIPIYSLNAWMPGSPELTGGIGSCDPTDDALPLVCAPANQKDIVYDLSSVAIRPGALTVPTFTVTSVPVRMPAAPNDFRQTPIGSLALAQPWDTGVINWNDFLSPGFQKIEPFPRLISLPEFDETTVKPSMEKALEILQDRNAAYAKFWQSFEPSDHLRDLSCEAWGTEPCSHPEQDILERVTRFVARPGAVLKEDLEVVGDPRYPEGTPATRTTSQTKWSMSCDPADHSCQPLWPERTEPKDGWQILRGTPDAGGSPFDALRRLLRQETIDDDGTFTQGSDGLPRPLDETPANTYPAFDRTPDTLLVPTL